MAVWSSLSRDDTLALSTSYFGRYYRSLLFAAPTHREDYEGQAARDNYHAIPIKRDLSQIFAKFNQFDQSNTLIVTTHSNLIDKYKPNDLIIPRYSLQAQGAKFDVDAGMSALAKYLVGISQVMHKKKIDDVRTLVAVKSVQTLFDRVSHNTYSPRDYV